MAAYHKVEVSLNANSVEVGAPSPQTVNVVLPLVGPQGPQGPAGESGASNWDDISGKPSTFTPSAHTHELDALGAADTTTGDILVAQGDGSAAWTNPGTWFGESIGSIPSASSATPQALGVAAAGTSADFARADHVHAMPSAADLGLGGEVRFDASGSYTYTGQAAAGASESSAVWFIRRSEFSGAGSYVSTTTANNVEWDDRLTASYS